MTILSEGSNENGNLTVLASSEVATAQDLLMKISSQFLEEPQKFPSLDNLKNITLEGKTIDKEVISAITFSKTCLEFMRDSRDAMKKAYDITFANPNILQTAVTKSNEVVSKLGASIACIGVVVTALNITGVIPSQTEIITRRIDDLEKKMDTQFDRVLRAIDNLSDEVVEKISRQNLEIQFKDLESNIELAQKCLSNPNTNWKSDCCKELYKELKDNIRTLLNGELSIGFSNMIEVKNNELDLKNKSYSSTYLSEVLETLHNIDSSFNRALSFVSNGIMMYSQIISKHPEYESYKPLLEQMREDFCKNLNIVVENIHVKKWLEVATAVHEAESAIRELASDCKRRSKAHVFSTEQRMFYSVTARTFEPTYIWDWNFWTGSKECCRPCLGKVTELDAHSRIEFSQGGFPHRRSEFDSAAPFKNYSDLGESVSFCFHVSHSSRGGYRILSLEGHDNSIAIWDRKQYTDGLALYEVNNPQIKEGSKSKEQIEITSSVKEIIDWGRFITSTKRVKHVAIHGGDYVDSVRFTYDDDEERIFGGSGGTLTKDLFLESYEYITFIGGYNVSNMFIGSSLKIITNTGRKIEYCGNHNGKKDRYFFKSLTPIIGIDLEPEDNRGESYKVKGIIQVTVK